MKTLKIAFLLLALILIPSLAQAQQFTLTQTSLSADVTASTSSFQLTSVTGIVGQGNGPGTGTAIYIDRELASVISVSGKTVNVLRGINGTQATAHKASNMVLFGNPNAFVSFDQAGTCVVAQVPAQPTINVMNGNQWLCSSVTLTWVPGFGNFGGFDKAVTTAVATAGTILPSGPLFHVTGTTAIVTITTPTGCNATVRGSCQFTIIADGIATWTAAGNISVAGTVTTAASAVTFTWDATNSKWVPSRLS